MKRFILFIIAFVLFVFADFSYAIDIDIDAEISSIEADSTIYPRDDGKLYLQYDHNTKSTEFNFKLMLKSTGIISRFIGDKDSMVLTELIFPKGVSVRIENKDSYQFIDVSTNTKKNVVSFFLLQKAETEVDVRVVAKNIDPKYNNKHEHLVIDMNNYYCEDASKKILLALDVALAFGPGKGVPSNVKKTISKQAITLLMTKTNFLSILKKATVGYVGNNAVLSLTEDSAEKILADTGQKIKDSCISNNKLFRNRNFTVVYN